MESNRPVEGICQRLFNFLIDVFHSSSLKRVTLGRPAENSAESVQHSPDNNKVMRKVRIEYSQTNGLDMKDENVIQEEGIVAEAITVPVEKWTTLEIATSGGIASDAATKVTGILKTKKSSVDSSFSEAKSGSRGVKTVSIEEAAEEDMKRKKKGKNKEIMEETMVEGEVSMEAPSLTRSILWSNIDQRSDELIRRTREALRSGSGIEAGSS
ncbi:hypothetical protein Scep_009236 [Stephania cephalantha]|uniref:Uncharacterized protein n=1 Tax=Stephania cephalantha TaxID=152367 RepID=A0AAP0PG29_9MAGN